MLTVGSLFAGIGGFDLGLERTGHFRTVWQCEIDPFCQAVLAKHWPEVPKYDDIRRLSATTPGLVRPDVLCGGFPCQPFSSASRGRKHGTADPRHLWPEMSRLVGELRPTWVLAENVPQLAGPALDLVVSDLATRGFDVAVLELPACAFGYDHRRTRLWICGHANGDRESVCALHAEVAQLPRRGGHAGRVGSAHGVSRGLDRRRLAALGNAIVTDIATFLGELIVASELESRGVAC